MVVTRSKRSAGDEPQSVQFADPERILSASRKQQRAETTEQPIRKRKQEKNHGGPSKKLKAKVLEFEATSESLSPTPANIEKADMTPQRSAGLTYPSSTSIAHTTNVTEASIRNETTNISAGNGLGASVTASISAQKPTTQASGDLPLDNMQQLQSDLNWEGGFIPQDVNNEEHKHSGAQTSTHTAPETRKEVEYAEIYGQYHTEEQRAEAEAKVWVLGKKRENDPSHADFKVDEHYEPHVEFESIEDVPMDDGLTDLELLEQMLRQDSDFLAEAPVGPSVDQNAVDIEDLLTEPLNTIKAPDATESVSSSAEDLLLYKEAAAAMEASSSTNETNANIDDVSSQPLDTTRVEDPSTSTQQGRSAPETNATSTVNQHDQTTVQKANEGSSESAASSDDSCVSRNEIQDTNVLSRKLDESELKDPCSAFEERLQYWKEFRRRNPERRKSSTVSSKIELEDWDVDARNWLGTQQITRAIAAVTEGVRLHGGPEYAMIHENAYYVLNDPAANRRLSVVDSGFGAKHAFAGKRRDWLLPINIGGVHWALAHVMVNKTQDGVDFEFYNSMRTPPESHKAIAAIIRRIVRGSGWFGEEGQPPEEMFNGKSVPATRQQGTHECGRFTILNAWMVVLGLKPSQRPFGGAKNMKLTDEVIELAVQGFMDSRTIEAFLRCHGLVEGDVSNSSGFDRTLEFIGNNDYLKHVIARHLLENNRAVSNELMCYIAATESRHDLPEDPNEQDCRNAYIQWFERLVKDDLYPISPTGYSPADVTDRRFILARYSVMTLDELDKMSEADVNVTWALFRGTIGKEKLKEEKATREREKSKAEELARIDAGNSAQNSIGNETIAPPEQDLTNKTQSTATDQRISGLSMNDSAAQQQPSAPEVTALVPSDQEFLDPALRSCNDTVDTTQTSEENTPRRKNFGKFGSIKYDSPVTKPSVVSPVSPFSQPKIPQKPTTAPTASTSSGSKVTPQTSVRIANVAQKNKIDMLLDAIDQEAVSTDQKAVASPRTMKEHFKDAIQRTSAKINAGQLAYPPPRGNGDADAISDMIAKALATVNVGLPAVRPPKGEGEEFDAKAVSDATSKTLATVKEGLPAVPTPRVEGNDDDEKTVSETTSKTLTPVNAGLLAVPPREGTGVEEDDDGPDSLFDDDGQA